jgi:ABC-type multidrug transport system permease subunit
MKQMKRAWFIALKDLRLFATDRLALFFGLLFPFFFATAFYFVMQGVGGNDERLVLHLVTREARGLSSQIIRAMVTKDEKDLKPGETKIVWDKDYDAMVRAVMAKQVPGFIAFPADFTEGVTMGYGANLEVVVGAESTAARAVLHGFAKGIAARVGIEQVSSRATMSLRMAPRIRSGNRADIARIIQESLPAMSTGEKPPADLITFDVRKVGEVAAKNPSNFVIPGYLVMFVFFLAAIGAEAIVRERQNQTLERLLTSSVMKETILAGIFGGTAFKGLVQIILFWAVGLSIFRMDLGTSPAGVVILSVLMVLVSSAFSLMLATLVRTQRAAIAIGVLASLVLAPLGGCWWPLFITPKWMQFLARLTPHGWATTGFNKLMVFGADFHAAIPNMLALVGFTLLFGIVAVWRFRTSTV